MPSTSRWLVGSSSSSRSWSADQQRGQRDPPALAAGERRDRPVARRDPGRRAGRRGPRGRAASRGPLVLRRDRRRRGRAPCRRRARRAAPASPTRRPPAWVTRPASGGSTPREQPQQGRLAVAVAPDDPDAVARRRAEGDVVEQGAGAVGACDALEVDEVAPSVSCTGVTPGRPCDRRPRAPAHRPTARRTPCRATAMSTGVLGVAGEEDDGRARAGDEAAERAGLAADVERRGAARAQRAAAAGCRSLCSARPSGVGVAGAQRRHHAVGTTRGSGRTRPLAQPVELGVDLAAWTARRRRSRAPSGTSPRRQHRRQPLAAAGAERRAAEQRERHVAAERGGELEQVVAGRGRCPTARRSATSAAAASALPPAIPPATGMPLRMCSRTPAARRRSARRASTAAWTARLLSSSGTSSAPTRRRPLT